MTLLSKLYNEDILKWNSTTKYPKGSIIKYKDQIYKSLGSNKGENPIKSKFWTSIL